MNKFKNIKLNSYINLLSVLIVLIITITSCTDATFNPNAPIDEKEIEKVEKHKSTLELLTKHTWQTYFYDSDMNFSSIITAKFNSDGTYLTEGFNTKTILGWSLTEDSKYIITTYQEIAVNTTIIDTVEIILLDESNLHLKYINEDGQLTQEFVPYNPDIAKFQVSGMVINDNNINIDKARLIIVWQVYSGGAYHEYIWGNASLDSSVVPNFPQYFINLPSKPPLECLNVLDKNKMLGYATVILTNQQDLPLEGEITGRVDEQLIIGGLDNKAIIYKLGDYTDSARPWIGNFGQAYNIAEASSDDKISWMNYFPVFPFLVVDYYSNLNFPRY